MRIKRKLNTPPFPPTRAVNIGDDKLNYIPNLKHEKAEVGWSVAEERLLRTLKGQGALIEEMAAVLNKPVDEIEKRLKLIERKGQK